MQLGKNDITQLLEQTLLEETDQALTQLTEAKVNSKENRKTHEPDQNGDRVLPLLICAYGVRR